MSRRISFGLFVLDRSTGLLLKGGQPVPIGKRGIRLLEALASQPGETVSKSALLDAGWPGLAVEESNLSVQIALLRKAIGVSAVGNHWIETVPKIGYRFRGSKPEDSGNKEETPKVAVLPFLSEGRDQGTEFLAAGLCDELNTAISKVRGLAVIARSSSAAYKGASINVRQISAELGARFVIEGSIRQAGGKVRVTTSLVDGEAGNQLWSERFDRTFDDIFAVQDDISRRGVAGLIAVIKPVEVSLWPSTPIHGTKNVEAYHRFLQGRVLQRSTVRTEAIYSRYTDLFNEALALDDDYAASYAALAMGETYASYYKWGNDPAGSVRHAYRLVDEAITRDPHDAYIRSVAALVAMYDRNTERWSFEVDQALSVDQNFAPALALRAPLSICSGQLDDAIVDLQRAIYLDPHFTHNYLHDLGVVHLKAGDYEAAIAALKERILLVPDTTTSRAYLASALGNLGMVNEAREVWSEILDRAADFRFEDRISSLPFRRKNALDRIALGLERASLPRPPFVAS